MLHSGLRRLYPDGQLLRRGGRGKRKAAKPTCPTPKGISLVPWSSAVGAHLKTSATESQTLQAVCPINVGGSSGFLLCRNRTYSLKLILCFCTASSNLKCSDIPPLGVGRSGSTTHTCCSCDTCYRISLSAQFPWIVSQCGKEKTGCMPPKARNRIGFWNPGLWLPSPWFHLWEHWGSKEGTHESRVLEFDWISSEWARAIL